MDKITRQWVVILAGCLIQACSVAPAPDPIVPGLQARRIVNQRVSAVVVTGREDLTSWLRSGLPSSPHSDDADGGSATPITSDGYFLTANHVLARLEGRNVFVIHDLTEGLRAVKARVVWRSPGADLALLHIPAKVRHFYRWSPPDRWLPEGSGVIHGGIATGSSSEWGKLATSLAPEGPFTGHRLFKIDIPLQPGDSGGPVVDAHGALVGINSAVEYLVPMETAFFVDSEASRPNIRKIHALIDRDRRARNSRSILGVE